MTRTTCPKCGCKDAWETIEDGEVRIYCPIEGLVEVKYRPNKDPFNQSGGGAW